MWNINVNCEDNTWVNTVKKISPDRVYFIGGFSYNEVQRNNIKLFTKLHSDNQKKHFLETMQGKYNGQIPGNEQYKDGFGYTLENETKVVALKEKQLEDMFSYYSKIFNETSLNSEGIRFKILNLSSTDIRPTIGYITKVSTLFDAAARCEENILKKTQAVMWNNNVGCTLWKNGISAYNGVEKQPETKPKENAKYKYIEDKKIKENEDRTIAWAYKIFDKVDPVENNLLSALIPHSHFKKGILMNDKDLDFYIYDSNMELYKIEYDKINEDLNKMEFTHIQEKEDKTKEKIIKADRLIDEVRFPQFSQDPSYLTFLYLHLYEENNMGIGDTVHRLHGIVEKNTEEVYKFNMESLDRNMFFLFGYQAQEINTKTLPEAIYKRHATQNNKEKDEQKTKEHEVIDNGDEKYDIPKYNNPQNIAILERAIATLPQTSPLQVNQAGGFIGLMGIFNKICGLLYAEYFCTLNQVTITPINKDLSQLYITLILAYECTDNKENISRPNMYIGPSFMLTPAVYLWNKYVDILCGLAFVLYTLNFICIIKVNYNIYNNTWIITASIGGKTLIYGEEEYLESSITSRTIKMEMLQTI